jgi:peptidoglycan/xylan/chitin deacetylase (PgdA/CDA1 family)
LIPNASVETPELFVSRPQSWNTQSSGLNVPKFTYGSPGLDGQRAVRVDMLTRITGDAKWYFDEVPVTAGQKYTFSDLYKSDVSTTVSIRFKLKNGSYTTVGNYAVPKSTTAKAFTVDFTAPANAVSATVHHTIAKKGYLITDGFSLVAVPPPDTTAPTVSVAVPTGSLSGTVTLTAQATDNVGVAGVRFLIDGIQVGAELTAPPYQYSLNTTTLTNGNHTVVAVARDAAGNTKTSSAATVTVNNVPTPPATNLIQNPSAESLDAAGKPAGWSSGGWGTNTSTHSLVAGIDGVRALRVDTTSYTDGDAKWYFADVPVVGGTEYTFSNQYRSNRASDLTIRFKLADGTESYRWLSGPAAAANWTATTATFTAPADAVSLTVLHSISGQGWLETDKFSLSASTPPVPVGTGMITLTFDDGWLSQLQNAVPVLQQANLPASFYVITRANQGGQAWELVQNASLETATNGAPATWLKAQTGVNSATFTYATTGSAGARSARIDMTSHTSGGAAWYFQDVQVTPGGQYTLSHDYSSNVPTTATVRFTRHDGTFVFQDVTLPSTGGVWKTQTVTVTAPTNADAMTIWHTIGRVGTLSVDNYSVKQVNAYSHPGYLTPAQIQGLQAAGFEVGSHTMTHADLATLSAAGARAEIDGARADLIALGITPKTFVYPYGSYTDAVKQVVAQEEFAGARTVTGGLNASGADPYALKHREVNATTTLADVQGWIAEARQTKTWLILTFHEVDNSGGAYSTTPETFRQIVNLVATSGLTPVTMADGLSKLG